MEKRQLLEKEVQEEASRMAGYTFYLCPDVVALCRVLERREATNTVISGPKHPRQPIVLDQHGVARFKRNEIVRFLLDAGPHDLNKLAVMPFSDEDREQFAQLIGYSVSGFGELSYSSDEVFEAAQAEVEEIVQRREPENTPCTKT